VVNKGRPLITGSIRQMTGIHYAALYVRCGSRLCENDPQWYDSPV